MSADRSAPEQAPRLFTTRQVCALLGCTPPTLKRWVQLGQFPPPLRLSSRFLRWDYAAIRAHLDRLSAC